MLIGAGLITLGWLIAVMSADRYGRSCMSIMFASASAIAGLIAFVIGVVRLVKWAWAG